jgi:hypothetical protein
MRIFSASLLAACALAAPKLKVGLMLRYAGMMAGRVSAKGTQLAMTYQP